MYCKNEYAVTVPVVSSVFNRYDKDAIVKELQRIGAKRVFLTRSIYNHDPELRKQELEALKANCAYLKRFGFEVGIWGWSFEMAGNTDSFRHIRSLDGTVTSAIDRCPLDPDFRRFVSAFAADLAMTGVDIILFDDDYRLSYWGGTFACGCDLHLARFAELLGEKVDPKEFREIVLSGGPGKYRDAYLEVNREALEGFAAEIRRAVDGVAPHVRIGVCSCMNWDFDGTSPERISRILAGDTKPFLRLIGAVYWPTQPRWSIYNRLGAVIEFERMERSWCGDDMEIVAEGDPYPRPRYAVPASYMELFDTALMADGGLDGIMKYALDYFADPSYERGYVDAHCRNNGLRARIREAFSGKEACGMRIYEKQKKFAEMVVPEEQQGSDSILSVFYSPAAKMVSSLSIPSTYRGKGVCGIVFGENARGLSGEALEKGLILDLTAARILQESGIDTGLRSVGQRIKPAEEYFERQKRYIPAGFSAYVTEPDANADIQSFFCYTDGGEDRRTPASYYYENANGSRFLVFAFDMHFNQDTCFRSYARAEQLIKAPEYFTGTGLPASVTGCPDLYMLCKEDRERKLSVGLWNIFADAVYDPVITLHKQYSNIRFLNCRGQLEGDKVTVSHIAAFGFAGFEVW